MSDATPPLGRTHPFWGQFADAASLPNVAGSLTQSPPIGGVNILDAGDEAWSIADACLYVCEDPTTGAAIWNCLMTRGGPGAGGIISWGNDTVAASQNPDRFLSPWYDDQVAPTSAILVPVPFAGTLRNMTILIGIPTAETNRIRFTIQVNGVNTSLTVTIACNVATTLSDNVNEAIVAQGDTLAVLVEKIDGTLSPQPSEIFCTFRWT